MASYRFWRLYFPQNGDAQLGRIGLTTVEMAEQIDGPSVCRWGIPYASSEELNFGAAFAFDDDISTAWRTYSSGSHWIVYDFNEDRDIVVVRLRAYSPEEAPTEFLIQGSDNAINWVTTNHYSIRPASDSLTTYFAQPGRSGPGFRFWRVRSLGTASGRTTIADVGFRVGGNDLQVVRPISSTTVAGRPENAFDLDATSTWSGQGANAWVGAEFPENIDVREVRIAAPTNPGMLADFPQAIAIDGAWEYGTWVNVAELTYAPFTAGEERLFAISQIAPSVLAKKVTGSVALDAIPDGSLSVTAVGGSAVLEEKRYGVLKALGHVVVRAGQYGVNKVVAHVVLSERDSPGLFVRNTVVRNAILRAVSFRS
mgnify:CR=1 FL=1